METRKQTWISTPWGASRTNEAEHVGTGIIFCSTPSHGGYRVDITQNNLIPEAYRIKPGPYAEHVWYEEDCGWSPLALTFPEYFKSATKAAIEGTLPHWEKWVDRLNNA